MRAKGDYRLLVRSDGDRLRIGIEGDPVAASGHVHDVRVAAEKLGISVHVEAAGNEGPSAEPSARGGRNLEAGEHERGDGRSDERHRHEGLRRT